MRKVRYSFAQALRNPISNLSLGIDWPFAARICQMPKRTYGRRGGRPPIISQIMPDSVPNVLRYVASAIQLEPQSANGFVRFATFIAVACGHALSDRLGGWLNERGIVLI